MARSALGRQHGHMRTDYSTPGPLTTFEPSQLPIVSVLERDPVALCRVAQGLVIPPDLATAVGIPDDRHGERNIRPASEMVAVIRGLNDSPLDEARAPVERIVGTCRDFSVLSVALLRAHGIGARSRCGFASYFKPGTYLDHWVTEYWRSDEKRWVRIDSEILGLAFVSEPDDLKRGEFLSGGEAWLLSTRDGVDGDLFGVDGFPENFGIGEIRGNAVRDLAALNKLEMLPWDEWSRMELSYKNEAGADFDRLIDKIAQTCALDDPTLIEGLYGTEDLAVPAELVT